MIDRNDAAQARALREQARNGGLRFNAYLPIDLADWLLDLIERGVFADPSEAVFVILGEHRELEPHADLRREVLKRGIQASIDDPRPALSADEFREHLRKFSVGPLPAPAEWKRREPADGTEANHDAFESPLGICGMKHADFRVGMEFLTAAGRWRVTDIGTRTVIAIKLDQTDPHNCNGPPYSIVESVFDEYDFGGCAPAGSAE
jgi:Arc/MetJ-type ribon-helix-helix transcriptional regulator